MPELESFLQHAAARTRLRPASFEAVLQRHRQRRRRQQALAVSLSISLAVSGALLLSRAGHGGAVPVAPAMRCDLHARADAAGGEVAPDLPHPLTVERATKLAAAERARPSLRFGPPVPQAGPETIHTGASVTTFSNAEKSLGSGHSFVVAPQRCVVVVSFLVERSGPGLGVGATTSSYVFDQSTGQLTTVVGRSFGSALPVTPPNAEQTRRLLAAADTEATRRGLTAQRVLVAAVNAAQAGLPATPPAFSNATYGYLLRLTLQGPIEVDLLVRGDTLKPSATARAVATAQLPPHLGLVYELRPQQRPIRPTAQPGVAECRASQMSARVTDRARSAGSIQYLIALANTSSVRCRLSQRPSHLQGRDSKGHVVQLSTWPAVLNQASNSQPAPADPGQDETIEVESLDGGCPSTPVAFTALTLTFQDGRVTTSALDAKRTVTLCTDAILIGQPAGPAASL